MVADCGSSVGSPRPGAENHTSSSSSPRYVPTPSPRLQSSQSDRTPRTREPGRDTHSNDVESTRSRFGTVLWGMSSPSPRAAHSGQRPRRLCRRHYGTVSAHDRTSVRQAAEVVASGSGILDSQPRQPRQPGNPSTVPYAVAIPRFDVSWAAVGVRGGVRCPLLGARSLRSRRGRRSLWSGRRARLRRHGSPIRSSGGPCRSGR